MRAGIPARALLEAPELCAFWQRIAEHVDVLVAQGWSRDNAASQLFGDVILPLIAGYDAHGTFARVIRGRVNMERRRRAAELARKLAEMLREIEREPRPPAAAIYIDAVLPWGDVFRNIPSSLRGTRPADVLDRIAGALEREPGFTGAPGLLSRKPSWRGYLREVVANLNELGFELREVEARKLVETVCGLGKVQPPSRDAVRDAPRSTET